MKIIILGQHEIQNFSWPNSCNFRVCKSLNQNLTDSLSPNLSVLSKYCEKVHAQEYEEEEYDYSSGEREVRTVGVYTKHISPSGSCARLGYGSKAYCGRLSQVPKEEGSCERECRKLGFHKSECTQLFCLCTSAKGSGSGAECYPKPDNP